MNSARVAPATIQIGDHSYRYMRPWDGRSLTVRGYLAFDTETEVLDNAWAIPRLALASASAGGDANCLIHPDQVGTFLLAHPQARWVFHNVAFDFWVVDRHLCERGEEGARTAWWVACDQGRMSDAMLLDQLIELARRDADPRPRDLATVGKAYARLEIRKDDPYRTRYGEILGNDWSDVEEGYFAYAIKDPIVTFHAYRKMVLEAHRLQHEFSRTSPDVRGDAIARFGVLSESVQVRGAVALEALRRRGLHLDLEWARDTEAELRAGLDGAIESLRRICPDLIKTRTDTVTGQVVRRDSKKTGTPSKDHKVLQAELARVVDEVHRETGQRLPIPRTANGDLSRSLKAWSEYAGSHPFLEGWIAVEERTKLVQFFGGMRAPVVHPHYRGLLRTGRTSCTNPNVQQIPRDGRFRQAFVASPGHYLLQVDYSFIELRTLAAVCRKRYGRSVLADVIRQGIDPHAYTASMILGVTLDEFMSWKDDDTEAEINGKRQSRGKHFKEGRQFAKPINFGVPGGLGAASLIAYARNTYGVKLTLEEARAFRDKLITEIYPELGLYLAEEGMGLLAHNLGASVWDLWSEFDRKGAREPFIVAGIRNIVRGKSLNSRGEPYHPLYRDRVWDTLIGSCRDPELRPLLEQRRGGESLCGRLFGAGVATLTGRIRGRVGYTQCRNTPFQGLAADGAKLALWRLIREGYRVVGFVHDEILVELPDEGGHVSSLRVERVKAIMCEEMASVLVGDIPVECEAALSKRWSKDARLIVRDDRVYPWEPEVGRAKPA